MTVQPFYKTTSEYMRLLCMTMLLLMRPYTLDSKYKQDNILSCLKRRFVGKSQPKYQSCLKASIGFRIDAFLAGHTPKIKPISPEKQKANPMEKGVI